MKTYGILDVRGLGTVGEMPCGHDIWSRNAVSFASFYAVSAGIVSYPVNEATSNWTTAALGNLLIVSKYEAIIPHWSNGTKALKERGKEHGFFLGKSVYITNVSIHNFYKHESLHSW